MTTYEPDDGRTEREQREDDEREHGTVLPAEDGDPDQSDVSDDQDSDDTGDPASSSGTDDDGKDDDGGTGPD